MLSEKLFQITLIASFLVHAVVLSFNPGIFPAIQKERKENEKNIEVHYLKPVKQIKIPSVNKSEPLLKLPSRIVPSEKLPSLSNAEIFKVNKEPALEKSDFTKPVPVPNFLATKPEVIAVKTKISLSTSELEKNASPSYVSHSQIVRERIKRALYKNYNRMEVGQVHLSFILTRGGVLRDVHLMEGDSSKNTYLKKISLSSIQDAVPFPAFPKDLNYDELSFNVIISFEIE